MHFVSMYLHIGRRFDSQSDLPAFDAEHHNADIGTDGDALSPTSC
jgi:hypothetical protein